MLTIILDADASKDAGDSANGADQLYNFQTVIGVNGHWCRRLHKDNFTAANAAPVAQK